MGELKSAYELANERIIAPRYTKKPEEDESFDDVGVEKIDMDFIEIPEFSNKEGKLIEGNETKIIRKGDRANRINEEREEKVDEVKVQQAQTIHFEDGKMMEVYWNGHFLDYGGFARMNRTMVFGLSNRNVKVKAEIEPYLTHVNKSTQDELKALSNNDISKKAPKVFGVTVPTNLSHGGKKIVYTMIETSEKVHKDYSGKLNLCDEIWTPTQYGKEILEKSNVYPPIHVMPLGIDVKRYTPEAGHMDFGKAMKKFKFLSVFRWSYRKGFDILLRAYMREFSNDDDVSLLLVSRAVDRPEENGTAKILEDFNNIKSSIGRPEEELPHIALYIKPIQEMNMPKVYSSANAFALISRGEGFGLPYCEAAACGLPVIGSNCSGQSDFLNNENSYLVEPDGYIEANVSGAMNQMAKLCHFYEGQLFPNFGQGAIEQTQTHLRDVYDNYQEAQEKADKLKRLIVNNYTWDMAVDRVYKRLREITNE